METALDWRPARLQKTGHRKADDPGGRGEGCSHFCFTPQHTVGLQKRWQADEAQQRIVAEVTRPETVSRPSLVFCYLPVNTPSDQAAASGKCLPAARLQVSVGQERLVRELPRVPYLVSCAGAHTRVETGTGLGRVRAPLARVELRCRAELESSRLRQLSQVSAEAEAYSHRACALGDAG